MVFWRRDGKELYYLAADRAIMAVEMGSGSTSAFGKPTLLFRPSADIVQAIGPGNASVSRDGERFVIAVPRPQLRQLTMYDRQGKVVSTIGQPGFYNQPNLSPDGTRAPWSCETIRRAATSTSGRSISPAARDADHQRRLSTERADLVSGWQAGGLCLDQGRPVRHLSESGGRNR